MLCHFFNLKVEMAQIVYLPCSVQEEKSWFKLPDDIDCQYYFVETVKCRSDLVYAMFYIVPFLPLKSRDGTNHLFTL